MLEQKQYAITASNALKYMLTDTIKWELEKPI